MIRLSIIIPGYNTSQAWWLRSVGSSLSMIGAEDEIVVVDDGSDAEYSVNADWWNDPRVRVLHKQNGGLSDARNFALDRVQGKYVAFVDSDDETDGNAFDRSIELLKQTNSHVAVFGVKTIWVEERLSKIDSPDDADFGRLDYESLCQLVRARLFNYAWNKVYERAFLEGENASQTKMRFDKDGMPCEDAIFNLACVRAGARFVAIDEVGYIYYLTEGTLLSNYKPTATAGLRKNSDLWRDYCRENEVSETPFAGWAILTDGQLLEKEWANLWMRLSPYSLFGRYKWLNAHHRDMGCDVIRTYVRMAIRSIVRRYFYFTFLKKLMLHRTFGQKIHPWKGGAK